MSLKAVLQTRSLTATVKDPVGGTMDHTRLHGREEPDQHPVEAITGLREALAQKLDKAHGDNLDNPHGVTAQQTGARPDTWMPTAVEVGARPAAWMPTAEEVGARPATWLPAAADIGAAPATESDQYPGCFYRVADGVTQWLNPPMVLGVEYRTTERWMGKSIYTKLIDCGAVTPGKSVTMETGATYMVRYAGQFITGGGTPWVVPFCDSGSYSNYWISLGVQKNVIYIRAGTAYEGGSGQLYVQVWYTKD